MSGPHPWEFKRVWHIEPSPTDPDTIYAGVEDAAFFRSANGGHTWEELPGLRIRMPRHIFQGTHERDELDDAFAR